MLSLIETQNILTEFVDLIGDDPDSMHYKAAVLLLRAHGRRKHLGDLHRLTGYDREFVAMCLENLKRSGIWSSNDKITHSDWTDPHGVGFLLDVMTACGMAERVSGTDTYQRSSSFPLK
jgi:hypothetical protein